MFSHSQHDQNKHVLNAKMYHLIKNMSLCYFSKQCDDVIYKKKKKKDHHKKKDDCDKHKKKDDCEKHKKNAERDARAKKVEAIWKCAFPDATLFPVIGLPSNAKGVATLTHSLCDGLLKINGLKSKSPLSNNALYSFECTGGKWLNLYEIMLEDVCIFY
jgi:hypothetical protein